MSHYTVLVVVGQDVSPTDERGVSDQIELLLEPYDENADVEPYRVDEPEAIKYAMYFETPELPLLVKPEPPEHDPNRSREEHTRLWAEYDELQQAYGKQVFDALGPEEFVKRLRDSMSEDYRWDDKIQQLYRMSTYNPQSKWDWYSIGGRWTGMFIPKTGAETALGTPGVFGNMPTAGRVDVIRVGDIDWEAMAREDLLERQDLLAKYDADPQPHMVWGIDTTAPDWKEKYLARPPRIATHAWVNSEGWYQQGEMGWFGVSSDEMDEDTWAAKWMEAIKKLPPKTTVAIVDCHI